VTLPDGTVVSVTDNQDVHDAELSKMEKEIEYMEAGDLADQPKPAQQKSTLDEVRERVAGLEQTTESLSKQAQEETDQLKELAEMNQKQNEAFAANLDSYGSNVLKSAGDAMRTIIDSDLSTGTSDSPTTVEHPRW